MIGLPGDANGDGAVDAVDIGLFCTAININSNEAKYDLNRDQTVNQADVTFLITNVLRTSFGDANLDGVFNSSDLVLVFSAGQYEDADGPTQLGRPETGTAMRSSTRRTW